MHKNFVCVKAKILFSIFLVMFLLVNINEVNVAIASPETTYLYVDPSEVRDVQVGDPFSISVKVTNAPPSYAWEVYLSWDPNVLEVFIKTEGDFLSRGVYTTTFVSYPSFDDANVEGEITVGCSLFGDVDWASGDGRLFNLGFNVKAEGSTVINLFDTSLNDHWAGGIPSPTYYPNEDCFFYNSLFHDVTITSVTHTQAVEFVAINVTVRNEGNLTETSETFNVTVYADTQVYEYTYDAVDKLIKNTTVVGDEVTVGTKTITESLAPGATTTLDFTWNTTDVAGGTYTISAEAMGDDDTRDNLFIDGTVTVTVHDIAVTNVVPSPTVVTIGDNVTIDVTVENEGHFNETFDVTVYYDDTAIDTKTGIFLENGTSTTLTFTWDTTPVEGGNYNITATATVLESIPNPEGIDDDPDDNTFTFDGTVKVRGAAAPDILLYAAVGIVIIIGAAVAIYFIWFRKPT